MELKTLADKLYIAFTSIVWIFVAWFCIVFYDKIITNSLYMFAMANVAICLFFMTFYSIKKSDSLGH